MNKPLKKRFWKDASVVAEGAGFAVHLDGRAVQTPARALLVVPFEKLAQAIAQEWQDQGEKIDPATMPMTRRANAAIDKVAVQQAEVASMLAEYGGSDLICYRATHPEGLIARQAAAWDPLVAWAAQEFGAGLAVTSGVMPVAQAADSLAALTDQVHGLTVFELTGFHDLVALSGSLVLALAAIRGFAESDAIWQLSRVDDLWQEDQWGRDDEATEVAARKRQDFLDAFRFYNLSRA